MRLGYAVLYGSAPFWGDGPPVELARAPWFGGRTVKFWVDRACTAHFARFGEDGDLFCLGSCKLEPGYSVEVTVPAAG